MTALKQPATFKETLPRRDRSERARPRGCTGDHQHIVRRAMEEMLSKEGKTLRELSKV